MCLSCTEWTTKEASVARLGLSPSPLKKNQSSQAGCLWTQFFYQLHAFFRSFNNVSHTTWSYTV